MQLKELWMPLCIGGALVIAAGTLLEWMEVSIAFADGTRGTVTATGIDLYSQYRGRGMPIESSAPLIYMIIAIGIVLAAAVQWRDRRDASPVLIIVMLAAFGVMMASGSMAVGSAVYAVPTPGIDAHGIPEWLTELAGKDVSHATIGGRNGYLVSVAGLLISFVGVIVLIRDAKTSG